ncbi:hypothetical protein LTR84_005782 [Exophiala bonariae]|uniref:YjgF-like protein n=1 Tax=Exophiala bonariae TaxID=1690606 RepID=A0AAV9N3I7_9EURO|nr:hypothetical protein LTR84_005782 [Exophiala bonariae]
MSDKPTFHSYPGYGEDATKRMGYSQALRIGNFVRTSGQSGWHPDGVLPKDVETQVFRAFENVMQALKSANPQCEWRHVISIKSYHVDVDAQFPKMCEEIKRRMPHGPTWMCTGIPYVGLPGLHLEIEAEAYVYDV